MLIYTAAVIQLILFKFLPLNILHVYESLLLLQILRRFDERFESESTFDRFGPGEVASADTND